MNELLPIEMEQPECLVCGADSRKPFLHVANRFDLSQKFQLVQCQQCGLVYLCPRPTEKSITRYYQDPGYQPHQAKALSLSEKIYQAVRVVNNRYKRRLIEKYVGKGKILDYGCGTGEFLLEMKKSGWETYGFEPTPRAAQVASNYGLEIIEKLNNLTHKVLVITLWHVLEHVHTARHLLRQFHGILDPNGLLCLALPNRICLDARIFKQNWVAYDAPRHLYHFSPANFEKLLNNCGFTIESMKSLPFDPWFNAFLSAELEAGRNKMRLFTFGLLKSVIIASMVSLLSIFRAQASSSIIYLARMKNIR